MNPGDDEVLRLRKELLRFLLSEVTAARGDGSLAEVAADLEARIDARAEVAGRQAAGSAIAGFRPPEFEPAVIDRIADAVVARMPPAGPPRTLVKGRTFGERPASPPLFGSQDPQGDEPSEFDSPETGDGADSPSPVRGWPKLPIATVIGGLLALAGFVMLIVAWSWSDSCTPGQSGAPFAAEPPSVPMTQDVGPDTTGQVAPKPAQATPSR